MASLYGPGLAVAETPPHPQTEVARALSFPPTLPGVRDPKAPLQFEADELGGEAGVNTVAKGRVRVRQGDLTVRADELEHTQADNTARARGNVRVVRDGSIFVGPSVTLKLDTLEGSFESPRYWLARTQAGGTAERIEFKGEDITAKDPAFVVQQGLSHVPEGREVFALLSVRDNLLMGAYTRKDRDGVARDMELVFNYFPILRERAAQDAGLLSGGQQQMLAISRALMANPDLILLDEPSLGLSPKLTKEIFEIVVRINRERGTTILLVEQNANMALNASDYGYVLENGRIVMEDTCERLREKEDIKEFYLGMKETGVRGERRWKKKKTWR